jgi:hypothetical protein
MSTAGDRGDRDLGGLLDRVALSSPQQRLLRATAPLGTVVFLVLLVLAGGEFRPFLGAMAVALGLVVALVPESHAPVGLLVWLGLLWGVSAPGDLDGWLLLATADLLLVHAACTLASYGPPGLTLDGALVRVWVRRGLVCLAAGVAVWAAAVVVRFLALPGSGLLLGAALLVSLGWVGFMSVRFARADVVRGR